VLPPHANAGRRTNRAVAKAQADDNMIVRSTVVSIDPIGQLYPQLQPDFVRAPQPLARFPRGCGIELSGTFLFHSIPLIGQQNGRPEAGCQLWLIKHQSLLWGDSCDRPPGMLAAPDALPGPADSTSPAENAFESESGADSTRKSLVTFADAACRTLGSTAEKAS